MKKFYVLLLCMFACFVTFSQTCPSFYRGPWTSTTHPYTAGGPYRFTSTIPAGTGTQYIGKWMNDYRIKLANGNDSTIYSFTFGNSTYGFEAEYRLWNSSNGKPSSVNWYDPYGQLMYEMTTTGTEPGDGSGMIYDSYTIPSEPWSVTIPANPYYDRNLRFVVKLNKYFAYTGPPVVNGVLRYPDCEYPISYPTFPPGYSGVQSMNYAWVEIEQPAKKGGAFVNAGTGIIMAAGTPAGSGTTGYVPYPSDIQAGNLLLLVTTTRISSIQSTAPSGWTDFFTFGSTKVYYKIASGTETGTVPVVYSNSTTNGRHLRIFQFYNVGAVANNLTLGTSGTVNSVTCVDKDELLVTFIYHNASDLIGVCTGTNFSFTEPVEETRGGNSSLGINIGRFPTAGSSCGTGTTGNGGNTATFILK